MLKTFMLKIFNSTSRLIRDLKTKRIDNYEIYHENLAGKSGLEIGGPSEFFLLKEFLPIYEIIKDLDGCNFSKKTVWKENIGADYEYFKNKKGNQFICDAVDLDLIPSSKYDFVLASNVLEHIANPFKAMLEWIRVLKDDGVMIVAVPHKDATFDHNRPVTTLQHLIDDYEKNVQENDLIHLNEILELHDISLDPAVKNFESFKERSLKNYDNRCLHHHVFDTELILEIFNYFNLQILSVDLILPYYIAIMGKKVSNIEKIDNSVFIGQEAEYKSNSPFKSDKID